MARPVLAILRTHLRSLVQGARRYYLIKVWKIDIGKGCQISFSVKLDKTNPRGIHIGDYTIVTLGAVLLSHDYVNNRHLDTWIGKNCFIGARSIILPGVTVGDNSIVGAGSVVVQDVPPRSAVAGNPARVIKSGIDVGPYGNKALVLTADGVRPRTAG
jgi:acetyltransferase-like isoleucine patch superfamily enzyme